MGLFCAYPPATASLEFAPNLTPSHRSFTTFRSDNLF